MENYRVITLLNSSELLKPYGSYDSYYQDEDGKTCFDVKTFEDKHKHIIEANSKSDIMEHFKDSAHRVVDVKIVEVKKNNSKSSGFTLGDLFKEQLAGYVEKNLNTTYLKYISSKKIDSKYLRIEKRFCDTEDTL